METPKAPFSEIIESGEFQKDLKKLKRFSSIREDLEIFKQVALKAFHKLGHENLGIVQISGLGFDNPRVYKATKFACKSLKGRGVASGIRVIYAYYPDHDKIFLIEIYFKADQENEDRNRIKSLLTSS
jgi:mRNA-degrading endonuclease RelE of RelBE toxin-antitoxin system